ncbi:hypothetical protein BQ9231_00314 [Cedratvirus lausannensis]|uniref:Uncharacterized protein n=1 Tax=Cedratvirus lausannensis TaxID=2023205 RepID=A0A285PY83_9VIRU|nr:hypothetical protein BQ9231_00314 [Cedratvirus lausannensis]
MEELPYRYPSSGDYRECRRLYSDLNHFRKHTPQPEPDQENPSMEVNKFTDTIKNERVQRYISTRINLIRCQERF